MDLRETLLAEHSKDQALRICEYVGDDPKRFAELVKLMTGPVYRVSQRAAWPVSLCVERHPELIDPYYPMLLRELERDDSHDAVRRNVARLLQFVDIPNGHKGRFFDACSALLADVSNPVAIRVFSMTVAANIAKDSPELIGELKAIASQHLQAATAGFRSRFRKIFEKA